MNMKTLLAAALLAVCAPVAAVADVAAPARPPLGWRQPLEIGNYDVTIRLGDAEKTRQDG